MDLDKQKKIMKEIEDLTPHLAELQEFKERGLYLSPETAAAQGKTFRPIFDEHGKRIDSKAKEKKKTNTEKRRELRDKAFKIRVLAINKHLDEQFGMMFPKWAIKIIRKYPQLRPLIMKIFFTKVEITHIKNPVPFGSDIVTITCFWSKYSETKFIWEK